MAIYPPTFASANSGTVVIGTGGTSYSFSVTTTSAANSGVLTFGYSSCPNDITFEGLSPTNNVVITVVGNL